MDMRKHFGIALIGLTLLGAGCVGRSLPLAKGEPEGVIQSAIATYTEPATGLTFDYPSAWGEVRVSRELPAMDTGKRLSFGFTENDRVSMTAASADYSEGVGEGTPGYFTLRGETGEMTSAADAKLALRQSFDVISWNRLAPGRYRMVHNAFYGPSLHVSYLMTDPSMEGYATLMVNVRIAPAQDVPYTAEDAGRLLAEPDTATMLTDVAALVQSIR